jgi:hypothetical protein
MIERTSPESKPQGGRVIARMKAAGRRKIIWVPLALLLVAVASIALANRQLMANEAVVFEIGQSIRGRLDDLSRDFASKDPAIVASYFADSYRGGDFGFEKRTPISRENGITIEQWQASPDKSLDRSQTMTALLDYRRELHASEGTKFKMVFLNRYENTSANILMRIQNYGHDAEEHPTEDRGHFDVDLVRQNGEWMITRMALQEARRVVGVDSKYFVNVTAAAGIDFNTGVNTIFQQQRYNFAIVDRAAGGVATGDFDNDGRPDIFFAGSEASKLYRNKGDGTFEDVTEKAGLSGEVGKYAQGAVMADFDNDGCLDIYITKTPNVPNRLLRNDCKGAFTDVTEKAGVGLSTYSTTAAFADVDNDGYLDLYVGVYGYALQNSPDPPFHDRHGGPNHLFHNNGDGTFKDVSVESGVDDPGWCLGLTFWDYDNDGDQDLYIANDFGHKVLFQNDGKGHFKDVTKEAGLLDYGFGMSATPLDYDNDGNLDVYTSNIYSGTTWYLQHAIMHFYWVRLLDPSRTRNTLVAGWQMYRNRGSSLRNVWAIGKKFGEGNSLYHNRGDGTFESVGLDKGVNVAGWAWGSDCFDFDNDGDIDIHAVNGWISQKRGTDL